MIRSTLSVLAFSLLAVPAMAAPMTFNVGGVEDWNNQAVVKFTYDASMSKVLLDIKNTSPLYDPRITAFAFNVPTNVTGVQSFSGPTHWSSLFNPNQINTPGQFGFFDVAGVTGNNFVGGNPNFGIPRNSTFHFELVLKGKGLDTLTEQSFLGLLSHDPQGNPVEDTQFFALKFQRTGPRGRDSDVGIPYLPERPTVPEPATLFLLGSAASVLGLRARRKQLRAE